MADLGKQVFLCVQSAQNFENMAPSFYKIISRKLPSADLRQIKQIVDAIKRTIKNKKQDSIEKYYALRLLHVCLAALNPEFAKYVIQKMLSRLITLACFQSTSKNENRGELLFGNNMNKEYSKEFLKILLTCFQLWYRYHPTFSAFKTALTTLMKQGVDFPRCAKPANLKDTERFLLKNIISSDSDVFKLSQTSQDYRQSIIRELPPSMPSVQEILEKDDTIFSQKRTFQDITQQIIQKQSTVGAINLVKKYAKLSAQGDLEGMKGLIPSYRALKALKLQQESILEASLISGVQEAISHSLKMQEKIENLLAETKPFYDNAVDIFAQEEKKQKQPQPKPNTQFEISDDLLNFQTKLPSLPSQDSGASQFQRKPKPKGLLSEKNPDTPISFSFDEQFSHNIYPQTNSLSSVGFDLSMSGATPVANQVSKRISTNPFNFELSAIMPEQIKEINESERPSQLDSVSSQDEKDTPRITRKPAPPPPPVPCDLPHNNNPFDFSSNFATYTGTQTEKMLSPKANPKEAAFDWDFDPMPKKQPESGKTVNEWNFQFPNLAARTDSNLTESQRSSFKESPEKGVFHFEGALYHADSNTDRPLNQEEMDFEVPGEMSSSSIPRQIPQDKQGQKFISLNQTEPTKSLKEKIRESITSIELENTPDIFHPKIEKGPEAIQKSPPFRFDSLTQGSEKENGTGTQSNIASQGSDQPIPVRMSLDSRQGKYPSTDASSRKVSRDLEHESQLKLVQEEREKLKKENEILQVRSGQSQMRVGAMEKRIKEQEIKIGDLESKLSTKKLKQEQELKIAEARIVSYEKKMKLYQQSIMEKEEVLRGTRSKLIEYEVELEQEQGNYTEETKRTMRLEEERKALKQKLEKSDNEYTREHKLRQKYQSQVEEIKMQTQIEKRKLIGEVNSLKQKLKDNNSNTSLSVATLKLPPQRSLSSRKVSIFGDDPSPRDRISRMSQRRGSSVSKNIDLPIDQDSFRTRSKANTVKRESTRPSIHTSIELKVPDTDRIEKLKGRKGSSLSDDQDMPSTDRLHTVNIHRAQVEEIKNQKKPSAPFTTSARPAQTLSKRKGSKEFNSLMTQESETNDAPFYQTPQDDDLRRIDSMSSSFSLCSDIGAIGGIPLVNEFEAPGLEGLSMKSAMFYKQAVFLDRGVLFQDYIIQIGFIRETLKSRGFIVQMFVGNKNGSYSLEKFSMEPQKVEEGYVIENVTQDPSSQVPPRKQERRLIQIKVDGKKGFVSGPLYEVKFVLNGETHSIPVRVPLLLVQLVELIPQIKNLSERLFLSTFESLSEKQKLPFTPDFSRLNSMTRIEGVLSSQEMFTIIRPRETLEFRKGGLFFGCKFNENKVLGRLKISPHLNQSQIQVASDDLAVSVCVTTGLLEMLTLSGPGIPQY